MCSAVYSLSSSFGGAGSGYETGVNNYIAWLACGQWMSCLDEGVVVYQEFGLEFICWTWISRTVCNEARLPILAIYAGVDSSPQYPFSLAVLLSLSCPPSSLTSLSLTSTYPISCNFSHGTQFIAPLISHPNCIFTHLGLKSTILIDL